MRMNQSDIDFWNGSLKSAILIKREVEKLLEGRSEGEKEGIKIALKKICETKRAIEDVNGNSIKTALKNRVTD